MYMTPGEICKEYNQAKFKKEQIAILADQNCCEKEDIMKILLENGIELPAEKQKKPTAKPKDTKAGNTAPKEEKAQDELQAKPQSIPEAVAGALIARLEELEAEIVAKQKEIAAKEKEYKEIATFMGCKTA